MKRTISRLILVTIVLLGGWFIGSLRLPQIKITSLFWFGFVTCLLALGILIVMIKVWNKNAFLDAWIALQGDKSETSKARKSYRFIWIAVSIFIIMGGLIASYMIRKQNQLLEAQSLAQDQRISELAEILESLRNGNQVPLMSSVLDAVEREVETHAGHLTAATISRVVELSKSFKPYRRYEGDSLSSKELSPERGQLLISLVLIPMDSASFNRIKRQAVFAYADLQNVELSEVDLSDINLSKANLRRGNFSGSSFRNATMDKVDFWGANLDRTDFTGADLRRITMNWAEVNNANFNNANIDGSSLMDAKFRNTDFSHTSVQWTNAVNSVFNGATMRYTDFTRSDLRRANFSGTNMTNALLLQSRIQESIMDSVHFDSTVVHDTWLEELSTSKVSGTDAILNSYSITIDSSDKHVVPRPILVSKQH